MSVLCFHCQTESDDCVADYENLLTCESCADRFTRARWLADKARRERVEEAFEEQDSRLERDGKYVIPPINMKVRQAE